MMNPVAAFLCARLGMREGEFSRGPGIDRMAGLTFIAKRTGMEGGVLMATDTGSG